MTLTPSLPWNDRNRFGRVLPGKECVVLLVFRNSLLARPPLCAEAFWVERVVGAGAQRLPLPRSQLRWASGDRFDPIPYRF